MWTPWARAMNTSYLMRCGALAGRLEEVLDGYVHEMPVETFHGENEMFDEESEAFEAMPWWSGW